ncbi:MULTISPECIES: MFS transporter [unclassified Novosphingobium]|uniref:MFS transporter n=1 Tax=unclassified Novosphingobium TaxID=2644732 RepID=UPI000F6017BA|nr:MULTISPECIES: MFS transporter [unclassified Novosphingobium]QCI95942.1 MFS transporter [Novosphingobium sp. EMRT-2]RQW44322.1 MFS transporter [Novosphingobium sp. LASN5T]
MSIPAASVPLPHSDPASAEPGLGRQVLVFVLLLACEFLYGWAWNTVDVLRPYIRESLGLSLIEAGSAYSAQGAGALTGAIVLGQIADRIGRRRVLSGLVFGYGVLLLAGMIVASYPQLLLQRFLLGFFAGGSFPVVVGIYINLFQPTLRGRLAGTLNAAFSLSIVMLGVAMGLVAPGNWKHLLLIGGIPPLALALLVLAAIPTGSRMDRGARGGVSRLPVSELFAPGLRRQTLMLATMAGLNFFGYAAFSGWLTTYLTGERGFSAQTAGALVAWQFSGNIVGGFFWGWAADRFGRRFNAIGFLIASGAIAVYLLGPADPTVLKLAGLIYGAALCSSVIWGPWMAELYPPHLQSTAASIFNWGRVISFFAPIITAQIAQSFSLATAMLLGAASFTTAAVIWLMQRETLQRR